MTRLARYGENAIGAVKYLIAVLTILGGISAMLAPLTPIEGALGFLYATRIGLVAFGIFTVACGVSLLYGKLRKSKRWTGIGLMACYMCFLFAVFFQIAAFGFNPEVWLANAVFAALSGILWLRWRFKTAYVNPDHFKRDIRKLAE